METFLKIFVGFWVIWMIWYITGGPLRDDKTRPYVMVDGSGNFQRIGPGDVKTK